MASSAPKPPAFAPPPASHNRIPDCEWSRPGVAPGLSARGCAARTSPPQITDASARSNRDASCPRSSAATGDRSSAACVSMIRRRLPGASQPPHAHLHEAHSLSNASSAAPTWHTFPMSPRGPCPSTRTRLCLVARFLSQVERFGRSLQLNASSYPRSRASSLSPSVRGVFRGDAR